MGTGYRCIECGNYGADQHSLVCDFCYTRMPPYFRIQAEHRAIDAALLRQALMGDEVGKALRWTEQQYHEHMRKSSAPAPRESKKERELPVEVTDSRALVFELELLPTRNALDRMHYRSKRRLLGRIGEAIAAQIPHTAFPILPLEHAHVEIVRMSSVEPDPDALDGSVKPILDALQIAGDRHPYGAGVIANDSSKCITLHTRWQRAAPKRGRIVVMVTPK